MIAKPDSKPLNPRPLGLRLPENVIKGFKVEAVRCGISGSALFQKMWEHYHKVPPKRESE